MVVKLASLVRRKEGVSEEEFHKYWSETHAPIVLAHPLASEKILEYIQYHISKSELDKIQGLPSISRGDQWDGIAYITVDKVEDLNDLYGHPYYLEVAMPDEEKFLERSTVLIMAGYDQDMRKSKGAQAGEQK